MADKVFCKCCGQKFDSIQLMRTVSCSKSPTRKHELYEGSIKSQYFCKHCGQKFPSIMIMTGTSCHKSPTKRHEPAL
jgi:DNA-directed RNA polymerase subunit RPC12/RpoP